MVTNVTMIRKMGNFDVLQRTKDGMFNATELLKQWNASNPKNKKEKVQLFFNIDKTKEFIKVLEQDFNGQEITHLTLRGKTGGGTWMHPLLFIDFAMWINPKFKLTVLKFVYDELIKQRHSAGDGYKILSASGKKIKNYNFSEVATAIQWIVYNKTGKNLRQEATQEQLEEITNIQRNLAYTIDMGYICSNEQLMQSLRKMYNQKYKNF